MGIAYQRRDDETLDDAWTNIRDKLVVFLKARLKDEASYFELQRMQGRTSYENTGHTWIVEHDGSDPDVEDKDGNVILLKGVDPVALADEMIQAARDHCAEKVSRTHYRILAFTEDASQEMHPCGAPFKISAMMFDATSKATGPKDEVHGASMDLVSTLMSERKDMHKMLLDVLKQYPDAMSKLADTVGKVADQANSQDHSLDKLIAILNFRKEETQERFEHERYLADKERRAKMFGDVAAAFGPDVARAVMAFMRQYGFGAPASDDEADGSPLADRLNAVFAKLDADKIAAAHELVGDDLWSLFEAARKAATDRQFRAHFAKVHELLGRVPKGEGQQMLAQLAGLLGGPAMLELGRLLKETDPRG